MNQARDSARREPPARDNCVEPAGSTAFDGTGSTRRAPSRPATPPMAHVLAFEKTRRRARRRECASCATSQAPMIALRRRAAAARRQGREARARSLRRSCRRCRRCSSRATRAGPTRSTTSSAFRPTSSSCTAIVASPTTPSIVAGPRALPRPQRRRGRPPEGPQHEGEHAAQLRHAQPRGLPEGDSLVRDSPTASACRSSRSSTRRARSRGIGAEERGQSEAIGASLEVMARAGCPDRRRPSSAKAAPAARSRSAWPTACSCSSSATTR